MANKYTELWCRSPQTVGYSVPGHQKQKDFVKENMSESQGQNWVKLVNMNSLVRGPETQKS